MMMMMMMMMMMENKNVFFLQLSWQAATDSQSEWKISAPIVRVIYSNHM